MVIWSPIRRSAAQQVFSEKVEGRRCINDALKPLISLVVVAPVSTETSNHSILRAVETLLELESGNELGSKMSGYFALSVAALVIALCLGFLMGRSFGIALQKKTDQQTIERNYALRMNAQFDFEKMRGKADQIVDLANEIGMAAKTAHETVRTNSASSLENALASPMSQAYRTKPEQA